MSGGGEEGETLEFTPTWVVAAVCTVIVAISLAAERFLHFGGKFLKAKDQKPLYEALQKIKEGFLFLFFLFFFFLFFSFLFFSFHHPCFDKIQIRVHDLSLHCLRAHAFGLHFPPFDGYSKRHYQNLRSAGLHAPHASV